MRIDRPKRGKRAAKRLDLTDLRAILRDGRLWTGLGIATVLDGNSSHWRLHSDDGTTNVDVLVDLVLQPEQIPITARLQSGMWIVPNVGDECAVIIPSGRVDFMPIIVGILSNNSVPDGDEQPQPNRIVLVAGDVCITDGNGGTEPLVKRSEFLEHGHPTAALGPVSPPVVAPTTTPFAVFPGTTILRSK